MINIAKRPAEADDRAVPGHWEGDLIIGKAQRLGDRHAGRADHRLHDARCACPTATSPSRSQTRSPPRSRRFPRSLRASLTWDQGPEMRDWKQVSVAADIDIYFCDPHAPVAARHQREHQRAAAPVLPQGHRPRHRDRTDLDWVADELNDRPRKRLGFYKPSSRSRRCAACAEDGPHEPPDRASAGRSVPARGGVARWPRTASGMARTENNSTVASTARIRRSPCGPSLRIAAPISGSDAPRSRKQATQQHRADHDHQSRASSDDRPTR